MGQENKSRVVAVSPSISLSILTAIFSGGPGLAGFTGAEVDGGDDSWSYKTCKAPVKLLPPINQHSFLQAGCPSCHPTNSIKALKHCVAI